MRFRGRRPGAVDVRAEFAAELRAGLEARPWVCGPPQRRCLELLEAGEPVVVKAWELRRWTPHRPGDSGWLQLNGDGSVIPVVPVMNGIRIVDWRSVD